MNYSNRFLGALGAWQRGWREDGTRRMQITEELLAAIAESHDLPPAALSVNQKCYRKRFWCHTTHKTKETLSRL